MTDYTWLANELRRCAIYELDKESGSIYAQHAGVMFKAADAIEELNNHVEAKPFGNGLDVCPVCGKPSTIGKPQTNADLIRAMSDEELAWWISDAQYIQRDPAEWEMWLKSQVDKEGDG